MSYRKEDIVAAAREIRAHLDELVGQENAAEVRRRLDDLIAAAGHDPEVGTRIRHLDRASQQCGTERGVPGRQEKGGRVYAKPVWDTDRERGQARPEDVAAGPEEPPAMHHEAPPAAHTDSGGGQTSTSPAGTGQRPGRRFFLAELEDHPADQPLVKGEQYTAAFSVGPSSGTAVAQSIFPDDTRDCPPVLAGCGGGNGQSQPPVNPAS
jgi:hypothetical protein